DWTDCEPRAGVFVGRNLDVVQAGGLSVVDIPALSLAGRYEIIYVDYLQLIAPEDRRRPDFEQVTQISKDLHTMVQTTGITIVALSQLSRPQKSGEQEKSPGLHSLRQSGQIEQDADGVMLLYKEEPNNPRSRRCLKIAKNKEGEAGGIVMLGFDGSHQRFAVSMAGPPAKPKPRAPEYKQAALYDLPGSEKVPWEEEPNGHTNGQAAPHPGGGGPAAPGPGQSGPGAGGISPGNSPGPGDGPGAGDLDLPF
ncbi:MAG: DnaB-like helicase C-terminal domain-containing protein, partial [Lawsonibacter sp.]